MSELPAGWAVAPLSAISADATQCVPEADETFTYIDIGSVDREAKAISSPQVLSGKDAPSRARKKVMAGDTLVSMTRPNLNAVALVPPELDGQIASTGFDVLRPLKGIDPRWLGYLVRSESFVTAMSDLVQGALYPAVRAKDVRGYVAPVAPSSEQTRIADHLDTLLARIKACNDHLDAIPGLLKRFRRAVLRMATSGALSGDHLRVDPDGHQDLALGETRLRIPSSWAVTDIRHIVDPAHPLCYGVVQPGEDPIEGVPLIRVQDMSDGTVVVDRLRKVTSSVDSEYRRSRVTGGELLISVVGTIGRTAIVPEGLRANIARAVARVACRDGVSSRWVHYWLSTEALQWQLVSSSKEVARKTLNLSDLTEMPVALPSLEEQTYIVQRVDALLALAQEIENRCARLRTQSQQLVPQVLFKAFRGDLLPQDPNDEPAGTLLARLTEKRNKVSAAPKAHKDQARRPARSPKSTPSTSKAMPTKSRQDEDVKGQPYLAGHLRRLGQPVDAKTLYEASELPVADFYKQLAWEIAEGHVNDADPLLEPARHAA